MEAKVNKRYRFNTGVVTITLYANEEKLLGIDLDHDKRLSRVFDGVFLTRSNKVIENALEQFQAYFNGERTELNLPLDDYTNDVEKKVYDKVKEIKFGETIKFNDLVEKLNLKEKEVLEALRNNRFSIIVPTHRVIGQRNGETVSRIDKETQERLLTFEQNR